MVNALLSFLKLIAEQRLENGEYSVTATQRSQSEIWVFIRGGSRIFSRGVGRPIFHEVFHEVKHLKTRKVEPSQRRNFIFLNCPIKDVFKIAQTEYTSSGDNQVNSFHRTLCLVRQAVVDCYQVFSRHQISHDLDRRSHLSGLAKLEKIRYCFSD